MKSTLNIILISCGTFAVLLGVIGIFLPLLPTTPFLLLGAACYFRSSKRFYNWLTSHRWLGPYIKNYYEGNGIPVKAKIISISLIWISITSSIFFFTSNVYIKVFLFLIAVGVTWYLVSFKPLKDEKVVQNNNN